MLTNTATIHTYFRKLGLEPVIADIYLALYTFGPQTISELSRNAKVERTRIYRLIDSLLASNLIEIESHYKRGIIKAAPISNLQILINERRQEVKSLEDELGLIEQVLAHNSLSTPATRVQFYHGPEGIRQMQWNLFRSNDETVSIMHRPMMDVTGSAFFKRWSQRWNESDLAIRLIFNRDFLHASRQWHLKHSGYAVKNHNSRILPEEVMRLNFGMDIYNNVVAFYNWRDGEVFGVEMYNKEIAAAQRIFFEMLWKQTVPSDLHDIGNKTTPSVTQP